MKKVASFFWLVFAGLFVFGFGIATAKDVLWEKQNIPENIKSFVSKGNALLGKFETDDGQEFTVETRRGNLISLPMRLKDPAAPLFEMDVRLLDDNGFAFLVQFGGHGPIDGSWDEESEAPKKIFSQSDIVKRQRLFLSAQKTLKSLRNIQFKQEFFPEQQALDTIASFLETEIEAVETKNFADKLFAKSNTEDTSYAHYIAIWEKGAFFTGNIFGKHSGTIIISIFQEKVYQTWLSCNHGSCPCSSLMKKKCEKIFFDRTDPFHSPPMCETSYGFFPGQHVCNDDSFIQYYEVEKEDDYDTGGGTCADRGLRFNAPDCE